MAIKKKKAIKKRVVGRKAPKKRLISKRRASPAAKPKKIKGAIGVVTHYFPKVRAAVVKLKAPLSIGDTVKIKGHTTDFTQQVTSMQIDRVPIQSAKKGQEIGLLVESRVRRKDVVLKGG
jgi:putative protease